MNDMRHETITSVRRTSRYEMIPATKPLMTIISLHNRDAVNTLGLPALYAAGI